MRDEVTKVTSKLWGNKSERIVSAFFRKKHFPIHQMHRVHSGCTTIFWWLKRKLYK